MKFSMWIVNDWLSQFEPEPRIRNGEMVIKGVRYFAENLELQEDLLYVGHTSDFIPTRKRGVICANGEDMILLNLDDVYTAFNAIQEMLEFYNEWEMNIMRAIDEGASVDEFLRLTMPVLETTILVTDSAHSVLGIVHHPLERKVFTMEDGHLSSADVVRLNAILQQYASRRGPYVVDSGTQDIIRNFYAKNGELIGWFAAMGAAETRRESRMQLTESFCHLLDYWFRINEAAILFSPRSALFINILDGIETDPSAIRFKQEGIGWEGDPEMQLFAVNAEASSALDIRYLQKALSVSFSAAYCFRYAFDVLIIVNYQKTAPADFLPRLSSALKKRKTYCGSSFIFTDLRSLPACLQQAQLALKYGENAPGRINHCEDYVPEYVRSQINEKISLPVLSRAPEILKRYDAGAGTEYYRTLGVYLLNERDQTKAAELLFIHRNTLIYRIKKIESLIGTDLDDSRKRFTIMLSYYLNDPDFLS